MNQYKTKKLLKSYKKYSKNFQHGYTLVEVIMASFILSAILVVILLFGIYYFKSYNFSFEENIAISEAQRAIQTMSKEIREARDGEDGSYPLVTTDDQEIVFYSDVDNDNQVERVRYYLLANQLVKQVFNSVGSPPNYPCIDQCEICHQPESSNETITIPEQAWPAHSNHGDYIGACGTGGGSGTGTETDIEKVVADYIRNDTEPIFYYYNGDWPGDEINNPLASSSRLLNTRLVKLEILVNVYPNTNVSDFYLSTFTNIRNLKSNL